MGSTTLLICCRDTVFSPLAPCNPPCSHPHQIVQIPLFLPFHHLRGVGIWSLAILLYHQMMTFISKTSAQNAFSWLNLMWPSKRGHPHSKLRDAEWCITPWSALPSPQPLILYAFGCNKTLHLFTQAFLKKRLLKKKISLLKSVSPLSIHSLA